MSIQRLYTTERVVRGIYKFHPDAIYPKGGKRIMNCEDKLREHCHRFAVIAIEGEYCVGVMLTTSAGYGNIEMAPTHFEAGFSFGFHEKKGSYFVNQPLQKVYELAELVGMLSADGFRKVSDRMHGPPVTWREHVQNTCKDR
ncbi:MULTISPECIES: hypothetical protein [Hymenobacter]|uniref:Uncharacterized protein n=2 Tax=Hymenobacter TaxID=89966 RepID=A0A3R9LVN0_9BACT|nr:MULTISPECIES: hypothetical protein [Hymenobacter]QNE42084.1 hypothetical protein F1C16_20890 [Hymenobacter sp. NBH84]RSK25014.1 hypothetical protein EI290_18495 [Hymenobacter metallilatus]